MTTLLVNVAASTARMFTAHGPARCQPNQRARWRTNRLKTFAASREKVPTRSRGSHAIDPTVFIKSRKTSAVSTTDWMVETQLCKLRGTSDTFQRTSLDVLILYQVLSFIIWFLWTKPTIWLLIPSITKIVRACSVFYPYEGYRSVTPLDASRVNRTIFHNHSVLWYSITLIKGRCYIKHDICEFRTSLTNL